MCIGLAQEPVQIRGGRPGLSTGPSYCASAVRTLKTSEAASFLNVSPNTLRAWERRFGYPTPMRTEGKHRLYTHGEIAALRDALKEGLSISSAISRAREKLTADTPVLVGALTNCELDRADGAMEAALALRSVEHAVEDVLLPSLHEIAARHGDQSAPWSFAARWASDWLVRARRLAPAPIRPTTVLIGDATRDELDPDALETAALTLFTIRGGSAVLTLPGLRTRRPRRRPSQLPPARDRHRGLARLRRRRGALGLRGAQRDRAAARRAFPPWRAQGQNVRDAHAERYARRCPGRTGRTDRRAPCCARRSSANRLR